MVLVMLTHHGAHGKLKLFHLEDGGFNHQRDYKVWNKEKNTIFDSEAIKYLHNTNQEFCT
ncbi:MAG: hypothetical protein O7D30_13230 [Rickettsia endosymbiont of Ixodes persulcatus]|nr:hypothetical protein [Rickettsia endosymbiont of Ixodes persulcatus]